MAAPILSVIAAATGDSEGLWAHLFATVLPRYVANTLALMAGVGGLSLVLGVSTAWVVTRYEFPGRRVLEWMLVLPFAVPAYLIAYVYTDFLDYAGPVQGALRDAFGWQTRRDYWFPEIRSMGGAIVVMGAVLYPYVYMMARTAFKLTPHTLFEIARVHDRGLFRTVGLPLAQTRHRRRPRARADGDGLRLRHRGLFRAGDADARHLQRLARHEQPASGRADRLAGVPLRHRHAGAGADVAPPPALRGHGPAHAEPRAAPRRAGRRRPASPSACCP